MARATLLPGALSVHFTTLPRVSSPSHESIGCSSALLPSVIVGSTGNPCSASLAPPAMADAIPAHLGLASSTRSRMKARQRENVKGPVLFASTVAAVGFCCYNNAAAAGRRAGALAFLSPGNLLRQQAGAAALLQQRSRLRVHSVRAWSLKDSRREALHEVEGESKPIELGTPSSSKDTQKREEDGGNSRLDKREGAEAHSSESDRDAAANLLASRAEEEGASLKEEVKSEDEDVSGAVKGTIIASVLLLAVVGAFGAVGFVYKEQINDILTQFSDFLEGYGSAGYALFVLAYAGLEVLAIPAVPLTMSAGLLFGTLYGTILVSISGTLAATAAFLIARYVARDRILELAKNNKKFLAIDKAIGEDGFRVVTLLRLSPLLPFSLGNYLYGLTSVKLGPYVLGSWLGMLPGTWAYVSAGAIGRAFIKQESEAAFPGGPEQLWTLGIGLVATIFAASYVTRLAKEAMKDIDEA